jgi:hypothetical protein
MPHKKPSETVSETFAKWKRCQVPDRTAFYHTALDIKYRRGGLAEKIALAQLRYQRSSFRNRIRSLREFLLLRRYRAD